MRLKLTTIIDEAQQAALEAEIWQREKQKFCKHIKISKFKLLETSHFPELMILILKF